MEGSVEAVDLRPLSLGELLDRTFRLYRNHFALFVGIMAMPAAILLPINMLSLSRQTTQMSAAVNAPAAPPSLPAVGVIVGAIFGAMLSMAVLATIYSIAVAAASAAVSDVYLGRAATIRGSFQRIRGRFWRLVGVASNIILRLLGLALLPILVIGGSAVGIGYAVAGGTSSPIFVLFAVMGLFLAILAAVVLYIVIGLRYAVSIPIVMVEDLGVLATIRRSVFLTRGRRGQIFLTILVAGMIASVGVYVFEMPFTIAMMVSAVRGHASLWLAFATAASGAIGSALTGPISMIAIVLLYYDSRIRKEAFDLQFMMATLDRPAPAAGTVSPA
jgi:glycerophosphoryl diester phosphodiesterase family protein